MFILQHFQEAVGQETGLEMIPLLHKPERPSQLSLETREIEGSSEILDGINGGSTLLRPTVLLSPVENGQGGCGGREIWLIFSMGRGWSLLTGQFFT